MFLIIMLERNLVKIVKVLSILAKQRLVPSRILLIRIYESRNTWNKKLYFFPFVNNVLYFRLDLCHHSCLSLIVTYWLFVLIAVFSHTALLYGYYKNQLVH